ncbi:MAG: hypothetical protein U0944_02265 [Candidatus Moranbacteria bacterium]|nr:hypothetical protein [bacterium]MDP1833860.1 hypothetical protein [Candidatus Moranbacteria bacterium]MDZ4385222.1 hypothetical protein [Candidatus Moranbacteria bacterium]
MFSLFVLILYLILVSIYTLASLFIAYHLVKYSTASEIKTIVLLLFIAVSAGLLFSNLLLFFSIDWNSLFYKLTF